MQFLTLPKKSAIAGAVLAVFGGGALALLGDAEAEAPAVPAPRASITVQLVAPSSATFEQAIAATGTIRARDELIVGSDASGVRLLEVLVEAGSVVRAGQLLARADDAQLSAQLAQQRAAVRQAQAEAALARVNAERADRLRQSGVYSTETWQTRNTEAVAADARLALAVARRRELEVMLSHTRVVAPADGVIASRSATVGAVMQPGVELFRLIRGGELEWLAELPNHSIGKVAPGAMAQLTLDDGRTIEAPVRLVEPTMDRGTRYGLVHVALPPAGALFAGSQARGRIRVGTVQGAALPESAVFTRDGYPFVYVLDESNVAHRRRVETGARQGGLVQVAGLAPGARVVGAGGGFVKDGELVLVAPADPARLARAPAAGDAS